ncbi:MAG: hypothetical protein AB7N80_13855 [Bdellovibrionales bacterium]
MKYLFLASLLGAAFSLSALASNPDVDKPLDKIFFNAELQRMMAPSDQLWKVISTVTWNIQAGAVDKQAVNSLKSASVSDHGDVADYLFRQGFNYHVLIRLRWALGYDPDNVSYGVFDLGQLENTMVGRARAGVPEFVRVQNEHWQADSTGDLIVTYEPRIHWLLEAMKAHIDLGVSEAARIPHSLRNLFVNRHQQINLLVEFGHEFEKVLIQLQALQSSFKIKLAPLGQDEKDEVKRNKLKTIEAEWQKQRDDFLNWAKGLAETVPPMPKGRAAWEPLVKAIRGSNQSLAEWRKKMDQANSKAIDHIDKALDANDSSHRYVSDTPAELEIKRQEHIKKQQAHISAWEKNANFSYYRRTHKWPYKHYHSEEKGPYVLQSTETRTRDIHDIDLAPLEEVHLAAHLMEEGKRLLERRQQKQQIHELRQRLEQFKIAHQAYMKAGPKPPKEVPPQLAPNFSERFAQRNAMLIEWADFLHDESFRQEAHEAQGYLGLDLDKQIAQEYVSVLARLSKIARRFQIALYTTYGAGATGVAAGACAWWLEHQ